MEAPSEPRADLLDRVVWVHFGLLVAVMWLWIFIGAGFSGPGMVLAAAAIPVAFGLAFGFRWLQRESAHGLIGSIFAANASRRGTDYSLEESFLVRGEFDRAVNAYLARTLNDPAEVEPYFRLAEVHWRHRGDYGAAEEVYRELGRRALSPGDRHRLDAAMIDLLERSGDRERLRQALARYAATYRETAAGKGAVRRLRELGEG